MKTINLKNIRYFTGICLIFLSVNNLNFISYSTQNIFFGAALFFLIYEKPYINKLLVKIILVFIVILLLRLIFIDNINEEGLTSIPKILLQNMKFIIFVFFFSGFSNSTHIEGLIKWLFYSVCFSSIFGLLTHYIGEPFATFRMLFLKHADIEQLVYFTKGDRVVGLDTQVYTFAYPVVIGPILSLIFYINSKKLIFLFLFFICLLAVILNAERATLAAVIIISIYILYRLINFKKRAFLIVFIGLGILFFNWFIQNKISSETTTGYNRFKTQYEEGADRGRLGKQFVAIITTLKTPLKGANYSEYENLNYKWYGFTPTYPHNAYINIGFQLGVTAWLMIFIFISSVYTTIQICYKKTNKKMPFNNYYFGIAMCLIGLFIVALFHNKGPFNGDLISVYLIGLSLAPLNPKFDQMLTKAAI